jgi:hypothetical protein
MGIGGLRTDISTVPNAGRSGIILAYRVPSRQALASLSEFFVLMKPRA